MAQVSTVRHSVSQPAAAEPVPQVVRVVLEDLVVVVLDKVEIVAAEQAHPDKEIQVEQVYG